MRLKLLVSNRQLLTVNRDRSLVIVVNVCNTILKIQFEIDFLRFEIENN